MDFINDPIGTKYGCTYTYTGNSAIGRFADYLSEPNNGRKVKDPLYVTGDYFNTDDCDSPGIITLSDKIIYNTTYIYPTTSYALGEGIEKITKFQVDFSKYKDVLDFAPTTLKITAIPKDHLFIINNPIYMPEYAEGINSLTINTTNISCKVAISKDKETWYTWDSENNEFIEVDLTQDLDTLKNILAANTVINTLTNTDYATIFNPEDSFAFAILLSIEPTSTEVVDTGEVDGEGNAITTIKRNYNTSISYSVDSMILDYIGEDPNTETIQHFNFVKAGYKPNGNIVLYADRVVHKNITFNIVQNFIQSKYNDKFFNNSLNMKMRLPHSAISGTEDEYDKIINNSFDNSKNTIFWHTSIGSFTDSMSSVSDDDGTDPANTSIISRGSNADYSKYTNLDANKAYDTHGFRPVIEIDFTPPYSRQFTNIPKPALPEVFKISDLEKGKCISVDYLKDKNGHYGFANIGKAKTKLLPEYPEKDIPGSFYLICVGYDTAGNKICVADRVISTGLSFIDISDKAPNVGYNDYVVTRNTKHGPIIRLLKTSSDINNIDNNNEYDKIITNEYDNTKTIDQIWHTKGIGTFTETLTNNSTAGNQYVIIKGLKNNSGKQKYLNIKDKTNMAGYRPVFIFTNGVTIEDFYYSQTYGYEQDPNISYWTVHCELRDSRGNLVPYCLAKSTSGGYDKVTKYTTEDTIIQATDPYLTAGTNNLFIFYKDPTTNKDTRAIIGGQYGVSDEIMVIITLEEKNRKQAVRTNHYYAKGYNTKNVECNAEAILSHSPIYHNSNNKEIVKSGDSSFTTFDSLTEKIILE